MKFSLPNTSPRIKSYIIFLIVSLIWGVAGPVIKYTLAGFTPLTFLVYRFGLTTLVALPILFLTKAKFPKGKELLLVLLYSFLTSTVSLGLLFFGYDKTTALYGALLSSAGPILVAIGGVLFLKEIVTRRELVGIGIAFAGTVITVFGPEVTNNNGTSALIGNLLIFASLIIGVGTTILGKVLLRKEISASLLTNLSFIVGFLTTLPFALLVTPDTELVSQIKSAPLSYHLGVIYMALASGTLAYWLWHKAQKTIEIGEGGLFAYLYPIIGAPLAVFWLGEKITMPFIIGATVIAIGLAIAEYKKSKIPN